MYMCIHITDVNASTVELFIHESVGPANMSRCSRVYMSPTLLNRPVALSNTEQH